mmetsp:Transcript_61301/g.182600  ORF Transcript_61301/g.182600 Transcript_61301/m.182600 type:complete len:370 (-) Transcript_61301:49-1158(-)
MGRTLEGVARSARREVCGASPPSPRARPALRRSGGRRRPRQEGPDRRQLLPVGAAALGHDPSAPLRVGAAGVGVGLGHRDDIVEVPIVLDRGKLVACLPLSVDDELVLVNPGRQRAAQDEPARGRVLLQRESSVPTDVEPRDLHRDAAAGDLDPRGHDFGLPAGEDVARGGPDHGYLRMAPPHCAHRLVSLGEAAPVHPEHVRQRNARCAAESCGAVDVRRLVLRPRGQLLRQTPHGRRQALPQGQRVEVHDGLSDVSDSELGGPLPDGLDVQSKVLHVLVLLEAEDDAHLFALERLNVLGGLQAGAHEEARADSGIVHAVLVLVHQCAAHLGLHLCGILIGDVLLPLLVGHRKRLPSPRGRSRAGTRQ